MRFEVVPPPVEQRIARSLAEQWSAVTAGAGALLDGAAVPWLTAANVWRTAREATALLSPRALPGMLIAVALLLRVLHSWLARLLARRLLTRSSFKKSV